MYGWQYRQQQLNKAPTDVDEMNWVTLGIIWVTGHWCNSLKTCTCGIDTKTVKRRKIGAFFSLTWRHCSVDMVYDQITVHSHIVLTHPICWISPFKSHNTVWFLLYMPKASRSCNSSENSECMIIPKSIKDPLIKDFPLGFGPLFTYF